MAEKSPDLSVLITLGLLVLSGCSVQKRDFEQAVEVHTRSIAFVAAFAPFVMPSPVGDKQEVATYYGARMARIEIMKHALDAADYQALGATSGQMLRPVERIAKSFAQMMPHCALSDPKDSPAEQQKTGECWAALQELDAELLNEDRLAQRAGLKKGTLPHIAPEAVTPEAQHAVEQLKQQLSPVPSEKLRRALWQDPDASEQDLTRACDAAMREAKNRAPSVFQEVAEPCRLFRDASKNLAQVLLCGNNPQCLTPSVCAMIDNYERRPESLPAVFQDRLLNATSACQRGAFGPSVPDQKLGGPAKETGPALGARPDAGTPPDAGTK